MNSIFLPRPKETGGQEWFDIRGSIRRSSKSACLHLRKKNKTKKEQKKNHASLKDRTTMTTPCPLN